MSGTDKSAEDKAVREGFAARESGLPKSANPYEPGSGRHAYWNMGWSEADQGKPWTGN